MSLPIEDDGAESGRESMSSVSPFEGSMIEGSSVMDAVDSAMVPAATHGARRSNGRGNEDWEASDEEGNEA